MKAEEDEILAYEQEAARLLAEAEELERAAALEENHVDDEGDADDDIGYDFDVEPDTDYIPEGVEAPTSKAAAGEFSCGPMVMALIGRRSAA